MTPFEQQYVDGLPGGLTEGTPWRRAVAWVIDAILIGLLALALWAVLFVAGVLTLGLGFALMAALPAVPLLYHGLFVAGRRHATPGQAMLDLVVVRADDLGPPEMGRAVLFTLGLYLTLMVGLWPLLVVFFTDRHRALHDFASGVVVVRKEALTRIAAFANMGRP